jgi:hypothetical protein
VELAADAPSVSVTGAATRRAGFVPVLAVSLALAVVQLLVVYHLNRSVTIDIGAPGDGAFVTGFWPDEADLDYRYRWSRGESTIAFKGGGSAPPVGLAVRVQGPPSPPMTMTVEISDAGSKFSGDFITVDEPVLADARVLEYAFHGAQRTVSSPEIRLTTPTFRAPGDSRDLGIKVDYAVLRQDRGGLNLPPWDVVLWTVVLAAGLAGLLARVLLVWALLAGAVGTLPLGLAAGVAPSYLAGYIAPVAIVVGVAGLLVWQGPRVARWPAVVDAHAGQFRGALTMLAAMALYAVIALWAIPQVAWIGHADYAENANVARNLVEGRGFTVDYAAQFYGLHPGISHPAETWPLLQPLMIAPFFAVFGPQTWAAKLPNLFVVLALALAVFHVGGKLWDRRVGLLGGLLVLAHPYFFNAVLYPINDLAFTAIFFALAWMVWRQFAPRDAAGDGEVVRDGRTTRWLVVTGALAGLLVWSKPSGVVLLVGVGLWLLWAWRRSGGVRALPWRGVGVAAVAAAMVLLPLVARNLLAFGKPFYSTESLDAWILRYWPFHNWEDIYKYYVGSELPHPRWVVGGKFGYQNLFDAIGTNFRWVWEKGVLGGVGSSDFVLGPLALAGAGLGAATLGRRAAGLFGMVAAGLVTYAAFVLLYWHFEGRYFQVAVPWLYLLIARGLFWVWDRRRAAVREGGAPGWELLALPAAVAALLWPQLQAIGDFTVYDTRPTSFTVAMDWLSANSGPDDVVMTRDPWELNWHTRRKAVMIPNDDLATIERVAREYGATLLQLGGPTDGIDVSQCPPEGASGRYPTGSRPALGQLYCGYERPGYEKVYQNGDLVIYRLTGSS